VNNKYRFTVPGTNQSITIPIEMKWDFLGRDDSIEVYQNEVIEIVTGIPDDFEVIRFAHDSYGSFQETRLNYEFYFYSGNPTNVTASTINDWNVSYESEGFSLTDLYVRSKPFLKSFFKLDFYDTRDSVKQSNSFTVILPSNKSDYDIVDLSTYIKNVKINKPGYTLDYLTSPGSFGVREGFFYYWLKSRTFVNLDTFYMTVKFLDAKKGVYVRMMTQPQSSLPNKFNFDNDMFFYNKVVLDYNNKTYKLYDNLGNRIGIGSPIKWYEFVNP
jgi:hypothetical protein